MANSFSLLELFTFLEQELKVTMRYNELAPRASDQKVFVADIMAVESAIGWRPKVSKTQGVQAMVEWLATESTMRNG
jgi:CDP-paratose 2-epimerase